MVKLSEVQAANVALKSTRPLTAVVVGGTNGIGKGFLDQLASNTTRPKIYIVGRSEAVLSQIQSELSKINPTGTYISIQADDLTLLSNVEKATQQILAQEKQVDILFMSVGFLTFAARDETAEGLDKITSIRYYARMRFLLNLLPVLEAAPSPRVVSVLAGGQEGAIYPDDMSLRDPKNYGVASAGGVAASYNTLFMEQLQRQHPRVSFVHTFPGLVRTNLLQTEHFGALFKFFINWVVMPTIGRFVFALQDDAGARHLFAATSPMFAAAEPAEGMAVAGSNNIKGSGVYTLNENLDSVQNEKVLGPYRESGMGTKVMEHTMNEYKRILG
jgi:NAD(P)-dependent dehydrogenase (short-subunit alcohol dehydrogenase family)